MTISSDSPRASLDVDEPKVTVKEKALGIFRSLFPHSEYGDKSVEWDSFVDAMSKVGFEARRSGGSAVLFEPNNGSKWYGKGKVATVFIDLTLTQLSILLCCCLLESV